MTRLPAVLLFAVAAALTLAAPLSAAENPYPAEWFWGEAEQRAVHDAMIGKPAPKLDLNGWVNGAVTDEDRKGKIVVVDFWATWCGPCIRSIPHNNQVQAKYGDKGVIVLGVCGSRGQEKMEAIAQEHGIKYPVGKDHTMASAKAWNVMWWPTYAIIGRDGNVVCVGLQPHSVDKVLDRMLEAEAKAADAGRSTDTAEPTAAPDAAAPDAIDRNWREQGDKLNHLEGKAPPPLAVQNWINANGLTLEELKGKVVLVDFWATWCGPCIAAIPHNHEMMQKYGERGLVIIGVCHPRGAEKMADVVAKHGIKYATAADTDGKTIDAWGANSFPDYYLIDRAGNLRVADCRNGMVEQAVQILLDEKAE